MAFDITSAKLRARRKLHKLASAPAIYFDETLVEPVEITVRWHNKIVPADTINDASEIITGIERLIFNEEEMAAMDPPLELLRGGHVTIPAYGMTFELGFAEPNDGPVTVAWSVSSLTD